MQWLPISAKESKILTDQVVCYQKDRSNTTLYHTVHNKTQQILYSLPYYLHLLEEEDLSDFLLYCYKTIDYYLTSYRIGRLSYIGYLSQVVRKRTKYFISQKQANSIRDRLICEIEPFTNAQLWSEPEMTAETASYTTFKDLLVSQMDSLPELFNRLLYERKASQEVLDERLQQLKREISTPVNRKRFLIVLTLSPGLANQHLLEKLADILEVDSHLLSRYLNTANLMLEEKRRCKEAFTSTSNRHFRRLLEIENSLQTETDEKTLERLEALRCWTIGVYKTKVNQIRKMEFRLSHHQVGELLHIPKGTIDSSVHYMKRVLSQYMDEQSDIEYLKDHEYFVGIKQ
ncbi:MAG: hypothetical protein WCR85_03210 [Sphaerochaeta sp.]|jgi:hypothetical protein|nr:hypothetical protein [Sphaerochaeta sp.]MDD4301400.1 hypothetical protein [Sphaerochaeta sp.]